jgi:hypothetical protein
MATTTMHGCVSLALEYFASLQNVRVGIKCDNDSSAAEVEQAAEAVLRRAAQLMSIPTVPHLRWIGKDSKLFHNVSDFPVYKRN